MACRLLELVPFMVDFLPDSGHHRLVHSVCRVPTLQVFEVDTLEQECRQLVPLIHTRQHWLFPWFRIPIAFESGHELCHFEHVVSRQIHQIKKDSSFVTFHQMVDHWHILGLAIRCRIVCSSGFIHLGHCIKGDAFQVPSMVNRRSFL
jgi:hypothetical protein